MTRNQDARDLARALLKWAAIFGLLIGIGFAWSRVDGAEAASKKPVLVSSSVKDYPRQTEKHLCPVCAELGTGKKTTVQLEGCKRTLLDCGKSWWDQDGNLTSPAPCNTETCTYTCSEGHRWTETQKTQ